MKEITAKLARKYNDLNFGDEDQLRSFFEGFSSVSTEALEILVSGRSLVLFLNDVAVLDDECFELLSRIRGKSLELNGISKISKKQAECLSKAELDDLHLGRFNCEDAHIINLLLQCCGDCLSIGIKGRNLEILRAMIDYEGALILPGVCSVGIEESEIIQSFRCSSLTLHGLTEIDSQPLRNLLEMKLFHDDRGCLDIDNVLESNLNADAIKVIEESDKDFFSLQYDGMGKKLKDGDYELTLHD
jgi:hypothetical protein